MMLCDRESGLWHGSRPRVRRQHSEYTGRVGTQGLLCAPQLLVVQDRVLLRRLSMKVYIQYRVLRVSSALARIGRSQLNCWSYT